MEFEGSMRTTWSGNPLGELSVCTRHSREHQQRMSRKKDWMHG
ncbi:MAG: hypothetical protein R3E26_05860 [Nitrosomonas sp.]